MIGAGETHKKIATATGGGAMPNVAVFWCRDGARHQAFWRPVQRPCPQSIVMLINNSQSVLPPLFSVVTTTLTIVLMEPYIPVSLTQPPTSPSCLSPTLIRLCSAKSNEMELTDTHKMHYSS